MAGTEQSFANALLKLIFNGVAIPNVADNAASSPLSDWQFALHTDDPSGGDQTTHEAAYTSYARVAVARTSAGFVITDRTLALAADVVFPAATGGSEVETFFSIGFASSGASAIIFYGPLDPTIAVSSSVVPRIRSSSTLIMN